MKPFISFIAVALFVSCSSTKLNCVTPPSNMSAWWTFDANSNATSQDIAGSVNNTGAAAGGVAQSPGYVAGAACFDGSSGEIVVQNQAEVDFAGDCVLDTADPFTIDFWIKTDLKSGTYAVLDKRVYNALTGDVLGWSVYISNGHPGFQMAGGGGGSLSYSNFTATPSINIADGQWHFVAVEVQARCRPALAFIYVDGAVVYNFTPRVGSILSTAPLHIGRREPSLGGEYFKGGLDALEIFNQRALAVSELNAIYNAGPNGKCKKK